MCQEFQSLVDNHFQGYEKHKCIQEGNVKNLGSPYIIEIKTQRDLSSLNSNVRKAIKNGEQNIIVRLSSGKYYYNRLPVYLYNLKAKDVSISIVGNDTYLIAGGVDFESGAYIEAQRANVYLNSNNKMINLYDEVRYSQSGVDIIDEKTKECRIRSGESLQYARGMVIQLSEWFHSPAYKVEKIENGFIYFIAHDLKYDEAKKCYNVNYDLKMHATNPRYRIFYPQIFHKQTGYLHECSESRFLILYRVELKSFNMTGLNFIGASKGKSSLLYFREVQADKICIENCHFEYVNESLVRLKKTNNFVYKNNSSRNCSYGALFSDVDCENTIVKDNSFYRMGGSWTNCSCITCLGKNFAVLNNKFEDIGYISISAGYHSKQGIQMVTKGVIEGNEICLGQEYYDHCEKYSLVDGGAIYLSTLSEEIIVRYNCIHNYRGIFSNRAIYLDDGAMNVKIYGNVIWGVTNAHSILSWRAKSVNNRILQSNDGIDFYYNVIWGKYKFDERINSSCIHGRNIILFGKGESVPQCEMTNFKYHESDDIFSGVAVKNGKIIIPDKAMQVLRKYPTYSRMIKWIEED